MAPSAVTGKNEDIVWNNLYRSKSMGKKRKTNFRLAIGDPVRITKAKRKFEQGYLPNWTEEIFRIISRLTRNPPVYRLNDAMGESLQGTFYDNELQKVKKSVNTLYRVEEIVKEKMMGRKKWLWVKWKGYPSKFNSWVAASSLQKIK